MSFQRLDPENDPKVQASLLLSQVDRYGIRAADYYLYKQNGCPHGDSLQGLVQWHEEELRSFNALLEPVKNRATGLGNE